MTPSPFPPSPAHDPSRAALDFVGEHLTACLPGGYVQASAVAAALAALLAERERAAAEAMRERCMQAVADERQRCRDAERRLRDAEADWAYGGHVAATRLLDAIRALPLE